jgi:hypothetical protein
VDIGDGIAGLALFLSLGTALYAWRRDIEADNKVKQIEGRARSRELRRSLNQLIQATIELDSLTNEAIVATTTAFGMAGGTGGSREKLYVDEIKTKKSANLQNQQWAMELEKKSQSFANMSEAEVDEVLHDCEVRRTSAERAMRTLGRTIDQMNVTRA